ncbi:VCBS repeat-containing protein [Tropicimonas aquimaris]|uniref:VCBS repeat-containing protein n=1 Tax=Tropicimonas aquimaris TaxID=914152 RepID=A0ABW3ILS5_9RHOB
MRAGRIGLCLSVALAGLVLAGPSVAAVGCAEGDGAWVTRACYDVTQPGRPAYGHDVLGGTPEWDTLRVELGPRGRAALGETAISMVVPESQIIEDIAPRVAQVDGAGAPEVVIVISDRSRGARLAVLELSSRRLISTPPIGTRNRWLAPVGIADLDGDGAVELAYVDRPHLARVLRVWRYQDGGLEQIAAVEGVTNHRIGESRISGGLRDCGNGPEMVLASADWTRVVTATLAGGQLVLRDLGLPATGAGFAAAMECGG